jgi:hypothetical protein
MKKLLLTIFVSLIVISLVSAVVPTTTSGGANLDSDGNNLLKADAIAKSNYSGNEDKLISGQGQISGNGNGSNYTNQIAVHKGEESQLKVQTNSEFGSTIKSQNGNAEAKTEMKLSAGESGKTYAELSNGMKAEVKVMPDSASEKALEILGAKCQETGCAIELREVGNGQETKAVYRVEAEKPAKLFWVFKTNLGVKAQVDAESGEVIKTQKRGWAFLASE